MLFFATFIVLLIHAVSNAEPPLNHYQNYDHGRGKSFVPQWSPHKTISLENFNFQEAAYSAPGKPPEPPAVQPSSPQYSTPWLPIGNAIDQQSSGYKSEASRFSDYHVTTPLRNTPPSIQHTQPPVQHTQPPVQHTQPPLQHTQPPLQHTQPPVQNTQPPVQNTQPPFQHTQRPVQHTQPPFQHSQPPVQHTQPPFQHSQPPVQHTQPPFQHTPPFTPELVQHTPELVQHTPELLQHTPKLVQHTQQLLQHTQKLLQHTPQHVQYTPPAAQHTPELVQHTLEPVQYRSPPTQTFNRYPTQAPYDHDKQKHHSSGDLQQKNPHRQTSDFNHYQSDNNVQHWPSSYDVPLYAPMYEPEPNEDYSQVIDWASFADVFGHPQSAPRTQRPPNHRYKIVFIKTPRIPGYPPTTPPPSQDHEKTLIYVLVNKPDYDLATTPAPPTSTTPSKPEVYFIQYKSKSNQSPTGSNGHSSGDPGLYGGQGMNQNRYGSTFSKTVDRNSL